MVQSLQHEADRNENAVAVVSNDASHGQPNRRYYFCTDQLLVHVSEPQALLPQGWVSQ
jgi:hypothetical protein